MKSRASSIFLFFFFNDTATTEIYTLSLHDALPISSHSANRCRHVKHRLSKMAETRCRRVRRIRSEEHTSELQSQSNLVCRLLLEKKKNIILIKQYIYSFIDNTVSNLRFTNVLNDNF